MRSLWIALAFAVLAAGCIGAESSEPPIVGIRNMYNQPRYDTQERQPFFSDQRSMRPQVDGTVSREMEQVMAWATGRSAAGDAWLAKTPNEIIPRNGGTEAFLSRGKDRYAIYCAPCHSISGDGQGMVSRRAAALGASGLMAPSFHDDRLRHIPDGQLYATITNGVRNMPAYAHNLPVDDRWAIVQYVRALQLSQAPAAAPEKTEQSQ
jgi:mono/diheme cytochrome c family protein